MAAWRDLALATAAACALGVVQVLSSSARPGVTVARPRQQVTPAAVVAGTVMVPLDVRVTDERGNPVTDLRQEDFTITENGEPQVVRTVTPTSANADPSARPPRVFLIVIGRGRPAPSSHGVVAAAAFVRQQLRPQDEVGLIAWDRAIAPTTDHERVAAWLDRDETAQETIASNLDDWQGSLRGRYGPKEIPDTIQGRIDALFGGPRASLAIDAAAPVTPDGCEAAVQSAVKADVDLSKLYAGVECLRGISGEKHLVFVTDTNMAAPLVEDDRALGARASDARVALDVSLPVTSGLGALADLTGGTTGQGRAWDKTFSAIDRATSFEYLVEYQSSLPVEEGVVRSVTVSVARPKVFVSSRHLHFAPTLAALTPEQILTYSRVLSADVRSSDFKLKTSVSDVRDGDARAVDVRVTVDASALSFEMVRGQRVASLQVLVVCSDYARNESAWHAVDLPQPLAAGGSAASGSLSFSVRTPVAASPSRVRVVVYDVHGDVVAAADAR